MKKQDFSTENVFNKLISIEIDVLRMNEIAQNSWVNKMDFVSKGFEIFAIHEPVFTGFQ